MALDEVTAVRKQLLPSPSVPFVEDLQWMDQGPRSCSTVARGTRVVTALAPGRPTLPWSSEQVRRSTSVRCQRDESALPVRRR